jgi:hypothetical protein
MFDGVGELLSSLDSLIKFDANETVRPSAQSSEVARSGATIPITYPCKKRHAPTLRLGVIRLAAVNWTWARDRT